MSNIPLEVQAVMATTLAWLWANYGKRAVERAGKKAANEAQWTAGMGKYLDSLYERVGWVRILGRHEAVPLENVFTHVNLLNKLLAERRYDVKKLREEFEPRDFNWHKKVTRMAGDAAVDANHRLFILGKPGAGKTTFLKHTALRAIRGDKQGVPIFVSLNELAKSGREFLDFITHQLTVHGVPEAAALAESLLEGGDALVLLDGLDEVTVTDNKRAKLITDLNDFIYQYQKCPMVMTCRVAASDYSFTQFRYAEMADFDKAQIALYIKQWFTKEPTRGARCRTALFSSQNSPILELAQIPLLLSMLCLTYEEVGEFPTNRAEIYEEAMRALLVRWDSSRNIQRDEMYKQLTLKRKQDMLAHLAYKNFGQGDYFLPERQLAQQIEVYLTGMTGVEDPNGQDVLQAMEAHHGILVERAHSIHSFAHLTFQEYFTACYIADNEARDTLTGLIQYVSFPRWTEVFLLVAARLADAREFARRYRAALDRMIINDSQLITCLTKCEERRQQYQTPYKASATRAFILSETISHARTQARHLAMALTYHHARDLNLDLAVVLDQARNHAHALIHALDQDLAHDLVRARDLIVARDRAHDLALNFDSISNSVYHHDRERNRAHQRELTRAHKLALQWSRDRHTEDFEQMLNTIQPPSDENVRSWHHFSVSFAAILDQFTESWDPYRRIPIQDGDLDWRWMLNEERLRRFEVYLQATYLLVRCLQVAYLPEATRREIEEGLLLPPP